MLYGIFLTFGVVGVIAALIIFAIIRYYENKH